MERRKTDIFSSLWHPPVATFCFPLHSAHQALKTKFVPGRLYIMGFLSGGTDAHYFRVSKNIYSFHSKKYRKMQ